MPKETSQSKIVDDPPVSLEITFDPEVSGRLFRVKGGLVLSGNRSIPYLLLNATLLKGGRPLCSTRYLMIEVDPGIDCTFEISKNLRIWPGSYSCILEVSGPEGQMATEVRECRIIEPFLVSPALTPKRPTAQEVPSLAKEQPETFAKSASTQSSAQPKVAIHEEKIKSTDESDAPSSKAKPPEEDAMFVGSTTSNKYHRQNCRYAAKILAENRVYFKNEEEAKKQGYSPCKTCSP